MEHGEPASLGCSKLNPSEQQQQIKQQQIEQQQPSQ